MPSALFKSTDADACRLWARPWVGQRGPEVQQMWSPPSGNTTGNRLGLELCLQHAVQARSSGG